MAVFSDWRPRWHDSPALPNPPIQVGWYCSGDIAPMGEPGWGLGCPTCEPLYHSRIFLPVSVAVESANEAPAKPKRTHR